MSGDALKTDLRLVFDQDGVDLTADLAGDGNDLTSVSGIDNLTQALILRLLVDQGELTALAHPRYGSRLTELVGQTLDRANLELLRRYVKQSLARDPRVSEVLSVNVSARAGEPGIVDIAARVQAIDGNSTEIGVSFNAL